MAELDRFLSVIVKHGGSDLHIGEGQPPKMRVHGDIMPIRDEPISHEEAARMLSEVCGPHNWEIFEQRGDLDFAYEMDEASRFRSNYFKQSNGYGATFRLIPTKIATLEELGIPLVVKEFANVRGGLVLITGPTGSGKTTLVNLIPRVYDASAGAVLIDGRPIRDYPIDLLRRYIGFVPQETFLFSDTIRENIAFGKEDVTDGEVREAAAAANIAEEIERFPEQYKTMVGERGITLSGGQKQRTAIARALLRNPRILILDDALSSVDTQTEDKILNQLREIMRGRTTIFISHRVSTVRNADQIAVLHAGHIVELGTHDELLARNGYYTDLYNKQLLEEELAEV